jgi:tetratricopeptide (TPR) repeat protein
MIPRYSDDAVLNLLKDNIPDDAPWVKLMKANILETKEDKDFNEAEALYREIVIQQSGIIPWITGRFRTISPDKLKGAVYLNWGNGLAGRIGADQKNYVEASFKYEMATKYDPDNPAIYNNWGVLLDNWGVLLDDQGHSREAITKFQKAIELAKYNYSAAYNNMGLAQAHVGNPREAIKSYEMAINLYPEYAVAFINLGDARFELDEADETNKAIAA